MIYFPSIEIDDGKLYKQAHESFLEAANYLFTEEKESYFSYFNEYQLSELKTTLTKVQYSKYNDEQDLLAFDKSTELHFEIKIHIYIVDSDGDKKTLAAYILILNSNMEVVDDFLL